MTDQGDSMSRCPAVICFGEALWDALPGGIHLGGAPLNVAVHARGFGCPARLISAVGDDFLGTEIRARLREHGVDDRFVATVPGIQSGFVSVTITDGQPGYCIHEGVAWDAIPPPDAAAAEAAGSAGAFVFGSLALRGAGNRAALAALRELLPADCLTVCDVNLRPPFVDLACLRRTVAGRVRILKCNVDEAAALLDCARVEDRAAAAARLADQWDLPMVCLTDGAAGAGLHHHGAWYWAPAPEVTVADTVGAGDALLAALIAALSARPDDPADAITAGVAVGAHVAGCVSATPALPAALVERVRGGTTDAESPC